MRFEYIKVYIKIKRKRASLRSLEKFRLEAHRPDPIDLAIYIVFGIYESDIFYFCPLFDYSTFKLEVLDHNDGVSVLKLISIAIDHHEACVLACFSPVITVATYSEIPLFIREFKSTIWTYWQLHLLTTLAK